MLRKILPILSIVGTIGLTQMSCTSTKSSDPTPSTPAAVATKLSSEQKADVTSSVQSVSKVASAKSKTTNITNKIKGKSGGRYGLSGFRTETDPGTNFDPNSTVPGGGFDPNSTIPGGGFDPNNTIPGGGFDPNSSFPGGDFDPTNTLSGIDASFGEGFSNDDLTSLDSEFEKEFGGKVSMKVGTDGSISFTIDYGTGTTNPDQSEGAPLKLKGKMSIVMGQIGEKTTSKITFTKYSEEYKVDSLNYSMDGSMEDLSSFTADGSFSSASTIDLTITQGKETTKMKGNTTITGNLTGITEDGTYEITEGTEAFTYIASKVKTVFTGCDSNFGLPISGTATIKIGTETIVTDYGTGACDTKATVKIGDSEATEIDLQSGAEAANPAK